MAAHKGNQYNIKGRPGAKNKKTVQWEVFSEYCLNGGLVKFKEELNKLNGNDYVDSFIKLLEFHKPKLSRQAVTDGDGKPLFPSSSQKQQADNIITKFLGRNKTNPKQ